MTPALGNPSLEGGTVNNGGFDPVLAEARRMHRCAECGAELNYGDRPKSLFCSEQHGQRYRDRKRYAANVERERERSRRYYAAHREQVLARSQAKRDALRPPGPRVC